MLNSQWQHFAPLKTGKIMAPEPFRARIERMKSTGNLPNMLFHGKPGTGKTNTAWQIAEGDRYVFDCTKTNTVKSLVQLERYASAAALEDERKTAILDEADCLKPDAQSALRTIMDNATIDLTFILTTNYPDGLITPLRSRLVDFSFNFTLSKETGLEIKGLIKEFVEESPDHQYDEVIVTKVIKDHYPDLRKIISLLQVELIR